MLAKVFKRAAVTTLKNVKNVVPMQLMAPISMRLFSTELVTKNRTKLVKILNSELKHEKENYAEEETVQSFLAENNWKLNETEGSNIVELRKNVGDVEVIIEFASRSPQYGGEEGEQEEGKQQQNQEQDQQQQEQQEDYGNEDYCDFTVFLNKKGKGESLVYECSSYESEINVTYVHIVRDIETYRKTPRFQRLDNQYPGPDFNSLDERLQTSLFEYLKGFGINEELAVFIEHVSLDKEQRLYMRWLQELANFVEK